jgi:hypothetical protein
LRLETDLRLLAADADGKVAEHDCVLPRALEPVLDDRPEERDGSMVPRRLRHGDLRDRPRIGERRYAMLDEHTGGVSCRA